MLTQKSKQRARIICLGMVLAFSLTGCDKKVSDRDLRFVSSAEVANQIRTPQPGVILVDARGPSEFQAGTIPGAINLPLPTVDSGEGTSALNGFDRIIVFGDTPSDARAIALTKRLMGLQKRAAMFEEGYLTWRSKGLPTTSE
ncbi:MAG: rhodanese-like domain-containing protein [Planctomycetota bacterium]